MSENQRTSEDKQKTQRMPSRNLFGRRIIFSTEETISDSNIVNVVEQAFLKHLVNRDEIDYLWDYYKGKQPSLFRYREIRDELTQHIVENRANEIVSFKVGYIAGKPIAYISSASGDDITDVVNKLNDMMRVVGKATKDRELIEWCMICGIGYRYVTQNTNPLINSPFAIYTLDPRNTFVIRANDFSKRVVAGVNYVTDDQGNTTFTVYTDTAVYKIEKGSGKYSKSMNSFGVIPIIEYQNNSARQGCFEICLSLLDAINDFDCARNEAVQQFVQSLVVLYNCQVEEGTTADSIRQAGMILLKSVGDTKADIKILAEQLDQAQNQTLKDDMYNAVLQICGVPSQSSGGTSDSSNNGAVVLKNGWEGAETRAQDFETMFKLPEQEMLTVVAVLCSGIAGLEFNPTDIDVKFTRRNYENILSKSQTLITMLASEKVHPKCAYEASGLFVDTEEAYKLAMEWYDKHGQQPVQETVKTEVNEDE
jgi:SPP1 family phage portal protein